jgi:hypothetical protein
MAGIFVKFTDTDFIFMEYAGKFVAQLRAFLVSE